jgi:glycosyltransferase involved in cell wall biosynthesis
VRLSVLSVGYPLAPVGPDAAGGSEQILALLDRELIRRGHRSVVVACTGSRVHGIFLETQIPNGTIDEAVHSAAQQQHRKSIEWALQQWQFDLIHMHSLDFHAYLPPPGLPVLVTLHLPPDWYPPEVFHPTRPRTWLHCVSASQERQCPPSSALLPYIENGVPLGELTSSARKRSYALALGRVCPEKGFHFALDAAAKAKVPALVAGEVFRYRAHQEYFDAEIRPRLAPPARRFLGPVGFARKRRLLAGARCLLIPSLVPETSSLVAMEALACGTPVIAFPVGALPEIVTHGRTGFLVANVEEMAEAIGQSALIDSETCRQEALRRFSSDRMLASYFDRYANLARAACSMEASGDRGG